MPFRTIRFMERWAVAPLSNHRGQSAQVLTCLNLRRLKLKQPHASVTLSACEALGINANLARNQALQDIKHRMKSCQRRLLYDATSTRGPNALIERQLLLSQLPCRGSLVEPSAELRTVRGDRVQRRLRGQGSDSQKRKHQD